MEMVYASLPMRAANYYKPNMRKANYKPSICHSNKYLQVSDPRCKTNYKPNISNYVHLHSLTSKYDEKKYEREVETLKEEVRGVLGGLKDPFHKLQLIDWISKLALSHYFEEEISESVHEIACTNVISSSIDDYLYRTALCIRVLRQHGYRVPQGENYLMELYEAAQRSIEGEHVLNEAPTFSFGQLLHDCLPVSSSNCSDHDVHKSINKLTENKFIQDFGGMKQWAKMLTDLAVMDFHKRQSVYQEEVLQFSTWWNELGLAKNLKHARNQPLKCFAGSMGILFDDTSLSTQRVELAKAISFIYFIDDIYDLYGTLDELILFTEAINKWDYAAIETLPDYMKMCYRSLLDTTNEIAQKIYRNHGCNPIDSLKTTWVSLCSAFLVEAKWFASGEVPTAEVYLENGKVSSGAQVVLVHLFFLLGFGGGSRYSENESTSKLISSVATIIRLLDDLRSAKDEGHDGEDGSYIKCYMKDHPGLSVDKARNHAIDMITREWRILKRECVCSNHIPISLKKASLNFARAINVEYGYHDNQDQLPVLGEYVKFMLSKEATP